jgi:hypothetical protein
MKNYLSALLLGTALLTPLVMKAEEHHERRYYDREHKDYHEWNEREDRAYRKYLEERRMEYRDWDRRREAEQREYWRWRHEHPDSVLFRLDIH